MTLRQRPSLKQAKTFTLNEGDPVLYGKFLNKPGRIKTFKQNDKGDPTVVLEPAKGGKEKEQKLFKIREDTQGKDASSVPIYSAFTYLSRTKYRGADTDCDQVQDLIEALKAGDPQAAQTVAKVLARHPKIRGFSGVVVPVPRSSSGKPPLRALAEALVRFGIGTRVESPVVRESPVESSRLRRRQGLPGLSFEDHLQSIGIQGSGIRPDEDVLLVDDIMTTGTTIQAVAAKLRQAGHLGVILGATAGHTEHDPEDCPVDYVTKLATRWLQGARPALTPQQVKQDYLDTFQALKKAVAQEKHTAFPGERGSSVQLWAAWFQFYRVGGVWADMVVDQLAIPPKAAKTVELAVRLFSKRYALGKGPPDIVKWYETNEVRLATLAAAVVWPDRTEESGVFTLGPFTVHDTMQTDPKDLENVKAILTKAIRAVAGSGVPGLPAMAYGTIHLVGQLARKNWLAWYVPDKDMIYLRPKIRGVAPTEAARHLVHEIGHRYWKKRAPAEMKTQWKSHHFEMAYAVPERQLPAVGTVLPFQVNKMKVRVEAYGDMAVVLGDVTSGVPVAKVSRYQLSGWMQEASRIGAFPTGYAAKDPEEHFCESLSLYSLDSLTGRNLEAFEEIVLGVAPKTVMKVATRWAAKYKDKKTVKTEDGDEATVYEYSERQIANRNREKAERVEKLRNNLHKLQDRVKTDLKSDDPYTRLCALAVGLLNDTFERVGNDESAKDGHVGVTGWTPKHVTFTDGKALFNYVGKSGVKQHKETTDAALIKALKDAAKDKDSGESLFVYDEGTVDAAAVNDYLEGLDLGITAKDIRGLHANREMQERLKALRAEGGGLPEDKKEREEQLKKEFDEALEATAEAVGHEPATLKSQYLVPGLEETFKKDGTVLTKLNEKQGSMPDYAFEMAARRVAARVLGGARRQKFYHTSDQELALAAGRLAARWFIEGTRTPAEKEDDDIREMLKPLPKKKPAREDLRRNRMRSDDPDVGDVTTVEKDRDQSLNFKKVASRLAGRWLAVRGGAKKPHAKPGKAPAPVPLAKPPKKPEHRIISPKPAPAPAAAKPSVPEHKPGDVWQTETGWAGKNPDGVPHTFEDKDRAEAYAAGKELDEAEGGDQKDPGASEDVPGGSEILKGYRTTEEEPQFEEAWGDPEKMTAWQSEHAIRLPGGSAVLGSPHLWEGDEAKEFVREQLIPEAIKTVDAALKAGKKVVFLAEGRQLRDPTEKVPEDEWDEQYEVQKALHEKFGDKVQLGTWDEDSIEANPMGSTTIRMDSKMAKALTDEFKDPAMVEAALYALSYGQGDLGMEGSDAIQSFFKKLGVDPKDKDAVYRLAFPEDFGEPPGPISKVTHRFNEMRDEELVQKMQKAEEQGAVALATPGASHAYSLKPVLERKKEKGKSEGASEDGAAKDPTEALAGLAGALSEGSTKKINTAKASILKDHPELKEALEEQLADYATAHADLGRASIRAQGLKGKAKAEANKEAEAAAAKRDAVVEKVKALGKKAPEPKTPEAPEAGQAPNDVEKGDQAEGDEEYDHKAVAEKASKLKEYKSLREYTDKELESETEEYFDNDYTSTLAPGAFEDPKDLIAKIKQAKPTVLSAAEYAKLGERGDTEAAAVLLAKDPSAEFRRRAELNNRDFARVEKGFTEGQPLPPPIVLRDWTGKLYLMAGNTRMMGAASLGHNLPVKILDYDGDFVEEIEAPEVDEPAEATPKPESGTKPGAQPATAPATTPGAQPATAPATTPEAEPATPGAEPATAPGKEPEKKPEAPKPVDPAVKARQKRVEEQVGALVEGLSKDKAALVKKHLGLSDPSPELVAAEEAQEEAQEALSQVEDGLDHDKLGDLREEISTAKLDEDTVTAKRLQKELDVLEKPQKKAKAHLDRVTKEAQRIKKQETDAAAATKQKYLTQVAAALEGAESEAKDALAGKPVTAEMMERVTKDPFKSVNWEDPVAVARALAQQNVTNATLLDPAKVGGKGLSAEPLDAGALTDRSEAAFEQYRKGNAQARKKAAANAVAQLADLDPDSPQAKELNRIIDGVHLAMEAHGEQWDEKDKDGKLIREPLDPKHGMLAKMMLQQGNARVLLAENTDPKATREAVRDAMGYLDDAQLQEMAKDTPWQPIGELLGGAAGLTLDPEVAELLRGLVRDMGVTNMVTNQGMANALAGKKMPASNPLEVYNATQKRCQPKKSLRDGISKFIADIKKGGGAKAHAKAIKEIKRMQVREMAEALEQEAKRLGVTPDPQDPRVAAVRHAAETGDLSVLDADLKPARTLAQEQADFIEHMDDPEERARVQQMSPEEFQAMLQGIYGKG